MAAAADNDGDFAIPRPPPVVISVALLFAALSVLLIGGYRYLAQHRGWVDAPNGRSSHTRITPRGAGIIIVALTALATVLVAAPSSLFWLSLMPGLGIAAIGWWDDLRSLPAAPRFAFYGLCTLLGVLAWPGSTALGPVLLLAGSLGLLWLVNLYNFMDGINGLAALEAIFVLAASLLISPLSPYTEQFAGSILCIIGILGGFLVWNFPLAKVFMGDVGSAFLGFLLGLLALWSSLLQGPPISVWLILLGLFIVDTSYTLGVRIITGQQWHQAHRTHAYQKLNELSGNHAKTVAALMGVNIAWLLPLASALQRGWLTAPTALILAYLPLAVLCYALKAGIPRRTAV
ncbi:MAG TPA: hypothetical protein VLC91_07740 [Spongiibacteraceae bacterium]|nr:hypothetical protein [Spongiibacteraceae bacterium]